MINLLQNTPSPQDLVASLSRHRAALPMPHRTSATWRAALRRPLVQPWLEQIRRYVAAERDEPLPELTAELYADFHRTGVRLNFEKPYFERRRRLARSAICALETGNAADMELLLDRWRAIFEEESWALPAHTSHPSGVERRVIDLFCAETANLMGDLLSLFGSEVPQEFRQRVMQRLHEDVFLNYMEGDFYWMRHTNNWNAVCHQGVLGAALAVEEDQELVARMLLKAAQGLPHFLAGFAADGGTSEGPGYWQYGFGWYSELNRQLETRTGREFSLFEGHPQIPAIAAFGARCQLSNGYVVNFSDAPARADLDPALLTYLGRRFDDPVSLAAAANTFAKIGEEGISLDAHRCDVFHLTRLLLTAPETNPGQTPWPESATWFPDLQVLVSRSRNTAGHLVEFAAKAGHNAEHHNHNDCGSFLLNVNGIPALLELGAPVYSRAFFSSERYSFLAARSLGHSVPLINHTEQEAGQEFAAQVTRAPDIAGSPLLCLAMELKDCYPEAARCRSALRELELDRASGSLLLQDTFVLDAPLPVESALMTDGEVTVEDEGEAGVVVHIRQPGLHLEVRPSRNSAVELQPMEYTRHGGAVWPVTRIAMRPQVPDSRVQLSCRVTVGSDSGQ